MPAIPVDDSYELLVTARVVATTGTVSNTATVTVPTPFIDPDLSNNTATAGPTPVAVGPDLSIAKEAVGGFAPSGNGQYLLTVSNGGSGPTTGPITIVDQLPAGLSFVSATGAGWSCIANGLTITCTAAGPLSPGGSTSVTISVAIAPTRSRQLPR